MEDIEITLKLDRLGRLKVSSGSDWFILEEDAHMDQLFDYIGLSAEVENSIFESKTVIASIDEESFNACADRFGYDPQ